MDMISFAILDQKLNSLPLLIEILAHGVKDDWNN